MHEQKQWVYKMDEIKIMKRKLEIVFQEEDLLAVYGMQTYLTKRKSARKEV